MKSEYSFIMPVKDFINQNPCNVSERLLSIIRYHMINKEAFWVVLTTDQQIHVLRDHPYEVLKF